MERKSNVCDRKRENIMEPGSMLPQLPLLVSLFQTQNCKIGQTAKLLYSSQTQHENQMSKMQGRFQVMLLENMKPLEDNTAYLVPKYFYQLFSVKSILFPGKNRLFYYYLLVSINKIINFFMERIILLGK
jgi:hypothetical protein